MMLLQTAIAFIVVLGILIVVHELGHYWVARWCGVKVLRFSVGMGKVIFSRKIGPDQTEWAISILPFGGYVKMLDAREQDVTNLSPSELKREFTKQTVWRRIAIVAAGPLANFILAISIFAGLYMYGIPEPVAKLGAIPEKSIAYQSGLRGGELVTAINGEPIQLWSDLHWKFVQLAVENQMATLSFQRAGSGTPSSSQSGSVTVPLDSITTKDLEGDFLGKIGIGLARPFQLGKIRADSPAMRAGLKEGDRILDINGIPVTDLQQFLNYIQASPNVTLKIHGERNRQPFDVLVTPESFPENGKVLGRIYADIVPGAPEMIIASRPPLNALGKAIQKSWDNTVFQLKMLRKIVVGDVSWKNLSGPITIADYAGKTARLGIISYLTFIAIISLSLGVMNLLPIPVLDGGHLLYYALEVLTGRPISKQFEEMAQRVGLGILMTLMLVAVFNDIVRLMP
jgi:regulator of sigma E protease